MRQPGSPGVVAVGLVSGFLLGGLVGVLAAAALLWCVRSSRWRGGTVPAFAAVALLVTAAAFTVAGPVGATTSFANRRPVAHWCALLAAVATIIAITEIALAERPPGPGGRSALVRRLGPPAPRAAPPAKRRPAHARRDDLPD